MQIFSRWGEKLFEQEGNHVVWDGNYQSKACQQDVYIYVITLSGSNNIKPLRKTVSGNVTLLR